MVSTNGSYALYNKAVMTGFTAVVPKWCIMLRMLNSIFWPWAWMAKMKE